MSAYLKTPDNNVFVLYKKTITVGRENCDLNVSSPSVEVKHALIAYSDSERSFVLTDLNSPSGTYVNGCLVKNATVRLAPGDVIRFDILGPEYELCQAELPKVLSKTSSHDQPLPLARLSRTLPPSGPYTTPHLPSLAIKTGPFSPSFSEGFSPKSRPSSSKSKKHHPSTSTTLPLVQKPSSALRRSFSHGSLTASKETFLESVFLQKRSRSGGEAVFLLSNKAEKPLETLEPIFKSSSSSYKFFPQEPSPSSVVYETRYSNQQQHHTPIPQRHQNGDDPGRRPSSNLGDQGTEYGIDYRRFPFDTPEPEAMEKQNDLRHFTEQMQDLKNVDQDASLAKMQMFLELREKEARMVRDELNRLQRDKRVLSDLLSQMAKDLINKDAAIKLQERQLQERDSTIKTYVKGLQSKEEFILEQVRTIQQKDEALKEHSHTLNERDEAVRHFEKSLQEKEDVIKDQNRHLSDRDRDIEDQSMASRRLEEVIHGQKELLETKDKKLKKCIEDLCQKDDVIKAQTQCLLDKEDKITQQSRTLEDKRRIIADQEISISDKENRIIKYESDVKDLKCTLQDTQERLVGMFQLYIKNASVSGTTVKAGDMVSWSLKNLLEAMQDALQRELESAYALQAETERLKNVIAEEREAKSKLEGELVQALDGLEGLRKTTEDTIHSLEGMNEKMRESFESLENDKKELEEQLDTAKNQCRQLEDSEKGLRQKINDAEFELENFRSQVIQTTFAIPGMVPPAGPVSTRAVVAAIEQLATERNEMSRKIAELKGAIRQQKLSSQEESMARRAMHDMLEKLEEEIKSKGRWKSSICSALSQLSYATILPSLAWVRDIVANIYHQESIWQSSIEDVLSKYGIHIEPECKDCSELITMLHNNMNAIIDTKSQSLQELEQSFQKHKEEATVSRDELQQRLLEEGELKVQATVEAKDLEMTQQKKEMQKRAEEETEEKVRLALESAQQQAAEEKKQLIVEKEQEMEELKLTLDNTLETLRKKEDELQELSTKLDVAQQEFQGKSGVIPSSPPQAEEDDGTSGEDDSGGRLVSQLRVRIQQLQVELEAKNEHMESLQQELQEKSEQLLAERTHRPSSVPVSRKGRYAMNLERLVQNLSIENASYKLQLEQRDAIILDLKQQIGTLKQRHMPANLADMQQREMDELMERLQEKDGHIEALRQELSRVMGQMDQRNIALNHMQQELRQQHISTTATGKLEAEEIRKLNAKLLALAADEDVGMPLLNGHASDGGAMMPPTQDLIRCRYCKHDRTKLLSSYQTGSTRPDGSELQTRRLVPLSGAPPEIRRPSRRSVSVTRLRMDQMSSKQRK